MTNRMCVPMANKPDTVQRYEQNNCANPISCVHGMKRPMFVMWTPIHLDDHHSEVIHFIALLKNVNNMNVITAVSFLITLQ